MSNSINRSARSMNDKNDIEDIYAARIDARRLLAEPMALIEEIRAEPDFWTSKKKQIKVKQIRAGMVMAWEHETFREALEIEDYNRINTELDVMKGDTKDVSTASVAQIEITGSVDNVVRASEEVKDLLGPINEMLRLELANNRAGRAEPIKLIESIPAQKD